jgi:hypothetical protein
VSGAVLSPCPGAGCRRLTRGGRCDRCKRERRAERQQRVIEEIYDAPRWRNETRPIVLERDGYRCVCCGATREERRLDVAHIRATMEILELGLDPFDPELCETRCSSCHGRGDHAPRKISSESAHLSAIG